MRRLTTETAAALSTAPTLVSPASGATGVGALPTFEFSSLAGATSYQIYYHTAQSQFGGRSFGGRYAEQLGQPTISAQTTNGLTAESATTYFWRVRASNSSGSGPWSGWESFVFSGAAAPGPVTITSPAYNAVAPRSPLVTWDAASNATSYDVEVADDASFATPLQQHSPTGTSVQLVGLAPGSYFARVRGRGPGGAGLWRVTAFTTRQAPSASARLDAGDPPPVNLADAGGIAVDFSSLSSQATVTAEQTSDVPPGGFGVSGSDLATAQFWTLSIDGGGAFTSDVCFPLADVRGPVSDPATLVVYHRIAQGAPWSALSTQLRPSGTPTQVCAVGVTSFSDFGVGAPLAALPVELTAFEAIRDADDVRLLWETASETANAGFAIEREAEGGIWTDIGWTDGQGTTLAQTRYTFVDRKLPRAPQSIRYRLRQVDLDGTTAYSSVVEVSAPLPTVLALESPYPNPARGSVAVRFSLPTSARVTITAHDALGRLVQTLVDADYETGHHTAALAADRLASGLYFVRLSSGDRQIVRRVTVVR